MMTFVCDQGASLLVDKKMLAYSIRTAAQVTSVGETTIRTWIRDGILPVTKIGGKRLIQRSDLEQVLDRHKRS